MKYAHIKRGPCQEIPDSPTFRSGWERNIYRVLCKMFGRQNVKYEARRYVFEKTYRRSIDYCPDFAVFDPKKNFEVFYEVKGYLDGPSKTKLLGFKKHYPDEAQRTIFISKNKKDCAWFEERFGLGSTWSYTQIKNNFQGIVTWE